MNDQVRAPIHVTPIAQPRSAIAQVEKPARDVRTTVARQPDVAGRITR